MLTNFQYDICKCISNQDCGALFYCNLQTNKCTHYPEVFPPDGIVLQIIAYILIPIIVGISGVGGLGGGIVKVPVVVLILQYTTQQATSLTYPITFGGCVTNILILFRQRHPNMNKPLIDYGVGMILVPGVLMGTNTGVIMNQTLSEIILNVFFILFLFVATPFLFKKARQVMKEEIEIQRLEQKRLKIYEKEGDEKNKIAITDSLVLDQDKMEKDQIIDILNKKIESKNNEINEEILRSNSYFSVLKSESQLKDPLQEQIQSRSNSRTFSKNLMQFRTQSNQVNNLNNNQNSENEDNLRISEERINGESSSMDEEQCIKQLNIENEVSQLEKNQEAEQIDDEEEEWKMQQLIEIQKKESKILPPIKVAFLFASLGIMIIFLFILGTSHFKSIFGFKQCDAGYWIFFVLQYLCLMSMSYLSYRINSKEINLKKKIGYPFDPQDIQDMSKKSFFTILIAGFSAGFIAGMVGAGAGLVMVPSMLLLNMNPRVVGATSISMYFFISTTSILKTLLANVLSYQEILWFIFMGVIGVLVFANLVYYLIQKYKKQSVIIFIVFGIAILNLVATFYYLIQQFEDPCYGWKILSKFNSYCKK